MTSDLNVSTEVLTTFSVDGETISELVGPFEI